MNPTKKTLQTSLFLFLMLLIGNLRGQNNYYFEHYTMANGLSSNQIASFFADSRGYLWICTFNGLNRFDGYTFTKYFHDPDDSTSLPSNYIQNICEDKSGKLWIAMYNGLSTFDYQTNRFTTIKPAFENGFDKVEYVFCDKKNRIWISTNLGLYLLSTEGKVEKHWKNSDGIIGNEINTTYQDKEGNLWATGGEGVFKLNESNQEFVAYQVKDPPYKKGNFLPNNCTDIGAEDDTAIYTGSWGNGIRWLNTKTGELKSLLLDPNAKDLFFANTVFDVALFNNQLWLSTEKGLATYNLATKKIQYINDLSLVEFNAPIGGSGFYVHKSILWISTGSGVYKLDLRKQLFTPHKLNEIEEKNHCLEGFTDLFPLPNHPDSLILSTWTCGAYGYNIRTKSLKKLNDPVLNNHKDIFPLEFNKFIFDKKGNRWAACSHGIYVTTSAGKSTFIKPFPHLVGLAPENYFNDIIADSSDNIWALSRNGLYLFKNGSLHYERLFIRNDKEKSDEKFGSWLSATVIPNGDVCLLNQRIENGVKAGITVFKSSDKKFYHYKSGEGIFKNTPYPNTSFGIYNDGENIWLCSRKGLFSFNISSPAVYKRYTSYNGLISDRCLQLVFDKQGNIWTSSQDGISCLNKTSGKITNYYTNDVLPKAHAEALAVDAQGRVIIGFSGEWLFVYDEQNLYHSPSAEKVKITKISINGESTEIENELVLPYNFSNLSITFSAMNYLGANDNKYNVSIISNDKRNSEFETSFNELNIATLPHGKHVIKIESLKDKTSTPVIVTLQVKPAIWQTIWFWTFVFIVLCISVFFIARYRLSAIRKREQQENELKLKVSAAEMSALRSQMNPHFIFNALNGIHNLIWERNYTDASEYLTKFSRVTRKVLENSRSQLISLVDDIEVLHYFIQLEALNLEFGLDYSIEIDPEIELENTRVLPLFLQPFVENAIKHGIKTLYKKGVLTIRIHAVENELYCLIEDNGIGRVDAVKLPGHTSLGNTITKERLQVFNELYKVNARYYYEDLTSDDGIPAGTRVHIYLPLIKDD